MNRTDTAAQYAADLILSGQELTIRAIVDYSRLGFNQAYMALERGREIASMRMLAMWPASTQLGELT